MVEDGPVITEYFMASDDEAAGATIDRTGGPSAPPDPVEEEGLFDRRSAAWSSVAYAVLDGNGIEPTVQMSSLEAVLTGRDVGEVFDQNLNVDLVVASRDGGEALVVRLPDALTSALASASEAQLRDAAVPWSRTEEFSGAADPSDLAEWLVDLADFVREGSGEYLYCWVSV